MLQIYVTMATKPFHCLGFPKAHYFQKLYIYEERKKTIVRANNSFQLWMINTWVTYQNKKFFQIYVTMELYVTLRQIAIANV